MASTIVKQLRTLHPIRRLLAVLFGLALVGGLTTACSSDNSNDSPSDSSASDDSYYPHTMTMTNGEVEIPSKPQRIIALSSVQAAMLLDLNYEPIAFQADPDNISEDAPWLPESIAKFADSTLYVNGEANYEKIASLNPDLILANVTQLSTPETFERLNDIAPTVSANSTDKLTDWQPQFEAVGEAINKSAEAKQLIDKTIDRFKSVGNKLNDIGAVNYTFVSYLGDGFKYGNGKVLELFGMTPSPKQDNNGQSTVSIENAEQLDADIIFVWPYPAELKSDLEESSSFQKLDAVRSGNVHYMDYAEAVAINDTEPMALAWLLNQLTPSIEALM